MSSVISAKAAAVLEELRDKGESRPEFDAIIERPPLKPGVRGSKCTDCVGSIEAKNKARQDFTAKAIIEGSAEIRLQNSIDEVLHVRGHKTVANNTKLLLVKKLK
jgi:hypothetical protein